ncbi:Protocadherin-9 [Lamellibrachia satsuma]|nr:Protocadherin-9 [Lamellibrachia satsuma]
MTSRGRRIVFTWKQLLELSVVLFLNWSPCGAVNVVEVANERCRFQDIDGVSMRLVRDGEGVTYYNIKENHPVGTRVVQLAFAGVPNDIKLRAHTGNNLLRFRPIQRDLVLLRALDLTKDGDDVIHVVLNCTTLDVNVRMRITLLVIDLNNHRPAFKNSVYRMTISELTDVGDTVLQVTATDRDLRNQAFDYSVIPSNYSSYFNINTTDGGLTLAASLDYETLANFSLILVVRDKHQVTNGTLDPHWWNTASLSVSVIDEDDMAPQFEGTTFYMATVEAHAPTGTPLKVTPTIHAFDGDRSLNVSVEYTIINKKGDEPHPLFAISNSTGVVALRRSVAANEGEMVFLMLMAVQMDNPTKRAYALLRASVTAPNKHRPLFSQNAEEVRVVEGQPAGLYLLTVSATDDDTTAELIYRLCPATKKCLKYFQIDPEMGILKTARSLNFEEHEDHYVTVKVSDGLYEDTLHVHVSVVDVNEHTPTFEQPTYMFDVMMSEPYGSIHVGQLHAKDGDRNPSLYFSLRYAPAMFSIDDVGVLSAVVSAQSVDGLYNFTAVVTDGRGARKRQNTSLVSVRTRCA